MTIVKIRTKNVITKLSIFERIEKSYRNKHPTIYICNADSIRWNMASIFLSGSTILEQNVEWRSRRNKGVDEAVVEVKW